MQWLLCNHRTDGEGHPTWDTSLSSPLWPGASAPARFTIQHTCKSCSALYPRLRSPKLISHPPTEHLHITLHLDYVHKKIKINKKNTQGRVPAGIYLIFFFKGYLRISTWRSDWNSHLLTLAADDHPHLEARE